jgi:AhpD family alkylhydroperoxidase
MYGYGVSDWSEKRTAWQWHEPFSFMRVLYRESEGGHVALVPLIEYADAPREVRAVYDDIMKTRGVDWINNFWKALANDPRELERLWQNVKQVMAPGALDPLVKEMIYVAVSATNGCEYCTHSHTAAARKKGMSDAMLMELLAVVGLANETNRLANGLRVEVDPQFIPSAASSRRA